MAEEVKETPKEKDLKAEKKKIADERKKLKEEQKKQQAEAKKKAKELDNQEYALDEDSPGGFSMLFFVLIIVAIWLAILCIIIKLDVGGFGSKVVAPVIKNVPVVDKILPKDSVTESDDLEAYYGYTSLSEAVDQIKALELELTSAKSANASNLEEIDKLKAEIERLKTFESQQVEFQRIKQQFYEEVVYAENGPGADEYAKWYEGMDPTTAEYLYQQVVKTESTSTEVANYAKAYSAMDPKEAAAIFDTMTSNLELVGKILWAMKPEARGAILAEMDPTTAAQVTKIMDPDAN